MQLFIVPKLQKKGNPRSSNPAILTGDAGTPQLFIPNVPELLSQLRKVLRANIGDTIFVQPKDGEITRYEVKITNRTDKDLEGEIISEHFLESGELSTATLLIAMPNKREKAELIVQKLSEIGINEILFRPAERSVIKQRPASPQQGITTP
jgi:RsmE family RNA methyltransferase